MKNFICTKINKSSCNISKDFSTIRSKIALWKVIMLSHILSKIIWTGSIFLYTFACSPLTLKHICMHVATHMNTHMCIHTAYASLYDLEIKLKITSCKTLSHNTWAHLNACDLITIGLNDICCGAVATVLTHDDGELLTWGSILEQLIYALADSNPVACKHQYSYHRSSIRQDFLSKWPHSIYLHSMTWLYTDLQNPIKDSDHHLHNRTTYLLFLLIVLLSPWQFLFYDTSFLPFVLTDLLRQLWKTKHQYFLKPKISVKMTLEIGLYYNQSLLFPCIISETPCLCKRKWKFPLYLYVNCLYGAKIQELLCCYVWNHKTVISTKTGCKHIMR